MLSGRVAFNVYPGLKHPTSQSDSTELAEVLCRGWFFGVTYHNMRGAIASATAPGLICLADARRSTRVLRVALVLRRIMLSGRDPVGPRGMFPDQSQRLFCERLPGFNSMPG